MHDDQVIRHIDPDDQIDASSPEKARTDTEPDLNAMRNAESAAHNDETAGTDEHAHVGSDDACRCDDIEKAIIAHLDVLEGQGGCRTVALARVLAKECCDLSKSCVEAFYLGQTIIAAFKRRVEEIICSDEYAKRTGERNVMLPGNTILSASPASVLGDRLKN